MFKSWLTRLAERLLGPVGRGAQLRWDADAWLVYPPRELLGMARWRQAMNGRHAD